MRCISPACGSHRPTADLAGQIYLLRDALTHIAHILDHLFRGNTTALLYFVMIACPLTMNVIQARPTARVRLLHGMLAAPVSLHPNPA